MPTYEAAPVYAAYIKKQNRRLSNAEALKIANGIMGFSLKYGVDARLIMAIVMTESTFKPGTLSHAGAMGLGQLMPGTARYLGVTDPWDIHQNLSGTVRYLREHLVKYGKRMGDFDALVMSLAAYNAGPGAVARAGGVPPYRETQRYVQKVLGYYRQYCGY
jgi:soluble lytic murein transglycosylase-like protein